METASVSSRGHLVLKKALNPVFQGGNSWLRRCLYRCAGANHLFFAGVAPTYWSHSLDHGKEFFHAEVLSVACRSECRASGRVQRRQENGNERRSHEGSGACLLE